MKILLTGGRGFIGRWLTAELTGAGHKAIAVDLEDGDLLDLGVARELVGHHEPEVVVHLAAQVGRLNGELDWRHTIASNAVMTTLVAAAAAEVGARLVYTSTSEVYGDQAHVVCDEYDGPWALPHNLYGVSKRWGEEAAKLYSDERLTIVRPSMPYGPGVPPGRGRAALPNMVWQAHTRQPIVVHKRSARSWCWIGDAVRGYRLVIEKGAGGIFNLGRDDDEMQMAELALRACAMTGADPELVELVDAPPAQTVVKRLSTARLESLGWKPEVELEEGMGQVLEWVRNFDGEGQWTGDPAEAHLVAGYDRRRRTLAREG